jgi:hypothetical protein
MYFPNMIKKELMTKDIDMDKASGDEMKEAKKTVHDKFLAALMLNGANRDKYGELKRGMAENYMTGTSEYPEIANVLSLKSVAEKHRVIYNSWDWNGVFKVHTKDGVVEFKPSERGLHYVDVSVEEGDVVQHMLVTANVSKGKDEEEIESANKECMMVTTVWGNLEGYTRHEIKKAHNARRLQGMIGNPTERELKGVVREKLIANCPVTVQDVHNANRIFGPDLANLRGKTTRKKPEHVRVDCVKPPLDIIDMHKYVTLVADVMFVNGLPFLVSSS